MPKGKACRLDLTPEYDEGREVARKGEQMNSPYHPINEEMKNYAWTIGWQKGNRDG
jgi:hypothetical protein